METIIFSRIAMAGWIFLAVLIGSLWSTGSPAWQGLLGLLQSKETSTLAVALLGAMIGIGAPPAVGFFLERVVTIILFGLKRSMTVYPDVVKFQQTLAPRLNCKSSDVDKLSGPATFQVFFYTFANKELLVWARRRVAQVYASGTGVLAILLGLAAGRLIAGSFNGWFAGIALLFAILLLNDARVQSNAHRETLSAWIDTLDLSARFTKTYADDDARSKS